MSTEIWSPSRGGAESWDLWAGCSPQCHPGMKHASRAVASHPDPPPQILHGLHQPEPQPQARTHGRSGPPGTRGSADLLMRVVFRL